MPECVIVLVIFAVMGVVDRRADSQSAVSTHGYYQLDNRNEYVVSPRCYVGCCWQAAARAFWEGVSWSW